MIAPHEFKNKAFNKAVRGYSISEVDEYIDFLIEKYTEIYRRNSELEKDLHMTKVKYSELHNDEDAIRAVIIKAQKLAETIKSQAREEASKIIESAKAECEEKIAFAEEQILKSRKEIEKIKTLADSFRSGIFDQYIEHIKMLKAIDLDFNDNFQDDLREEVLENADERIEEAKDKIAKMGTEEEI